LVEDLPEDVVRAIAAAEVDLRYSYLDEELTPP
jgi:hypothetical protein